MSRWSRDADEALLEAVKAFSSEGMFRLKGERWGAITGYIKLKTGRLYRPRACEARKALLDAAQREADRASVAEKATTDREAAISGHVTGAMMALKAELGKLHGEVLVLREDLRKFIALAGDK